MDKKGIGILPGYTLSYIDHLVPLCQLLEIPLLVTDPTVRQWIELYYPPIEIILAEPEDYCLDTALEGYDYFVYVYFYRKGHGTFEFSQYTCSHRVRSVSGFHGNPDKWLDIYWIEQLADEDIALLYGPQMVDTLDAKGLEKRVEKPLICGNYRLEYYLKHKEFFDRQVHLLGGKPILLYAPTWSSSVKKPALRAGYSTFDDVHQAVFESIPDEVQLIVKLHPNHVYLAPDEVRQVEERYPHIEFLHDFPLIYPLLNRVDFYLGDYSSLGFDFLYFNRPMFFLSEREPSLLQQCGHMLKKEDLSNFLDREDPFQEKRREVYHYAFGPTGNIKEEICRLLQ